MIEESIVSEETLTSKMTPEEHRLLVLIDQAIRNRDFVALARYRRELEAIRWARR
jgi:DNA-directed RNA polymerase subunit L